MNTIRSLIVILFAGLLVACGPTKKNDQGKNDPNGLGRTGQGQRGGGNNGGGNNPTPAPTFQQYCDNLHGSVSDNICKYVWKKESVTLPPNPPDIYRINIANVHEGMSVQTLGDPNNAGSLYLARNNTLTKLLDVNDKVNRARLLGIGSGALVFISTAPFTVPAQITIFECQSPEHTFNNCPD